MPDGVRHCGASQPIHVPAPMTPPIRRSSTCPVSQITLISLFAPPISTFSLIDPHSPLFPPHSLPPRVCASSPAAMLPADPPTVQRTLVRLEQPGALGAMRRHVASLPAHAQPGLGARRLRRARDKALGVRDVAHPRHASADDHHPPRRQGGPARALLLQRLWSGNEHQLSHPQERRP